MPFYTNLIMQLSEALGSKAKKQQRCFKKQQRCFKKQQPLFQITWLKKIEGGCVCGGGVRGRSAMFFCFV
jgi:hypothetical protein